MTRDIHCVTKWSKLDTAWEGVLIDDMLAAAGLDAPPTPFMLAHSFDGYSTNVPAADLIGGKAMVALRYDGEPMRAGPWRAGAAAGAASLFLEVGEVGERAAIHRARRGRASGSCAATTSTAIPGASSASPVTDAALHSPRRGLRWQQATIAGDRAARRRA